MKHKKSEKYDICEFCENIWGFDQSEDCTSPCACATYINQDYVYQREETRGLLAPKALELPDRKSGNEYWDSLSTEGKQRVANKIGDLAIILDPILFQMLSFIIMGHSKEEICWEMDIKETTYDRYLDRLGRVTAPLEEGESGTTTDL